MAWFGKKYCVLVGDLTRDDRTEVDNSDHLAPILTADHYRKLCQRGKLVRLRRGGGRGCQALVEYDSLPDDIKERYKAKYPNHKCEDEVVRNQYVSAYSRDYEAYSYYLRVLTERNNSLTGERIMELVEEYTTNASVIRAVLHLKGEISLYRKVRQGRALSWQNMMGAVSHYKEVYKHTLPTTATRFSKVAKAYSERGYEALISRKFGNANTRKVDLKTERLLMELASDKHRPHGKTVWQWYCDFLAGEVEYINPATGEAYNPDEYPDLSEKTVGDILSKPLNEARLSKTHDARHDYNTTLRPYHKRIKPKYSLSMVSMDDKDFAVKIRWCMQETKQVRGKEVTTKKWVNTSLKAYICYDVASEAIIGYAFSGEKNRDIFEGCVRSMYRNLLAWGLGQPYEAQVENHLVSLYKDTMMKSGALFTEVTFAGAENSQEKYAERYNETLKYQFEKYAISEPIGRPHARLAANRTKNRKVSDASNDNYLHNEYSFDEAVRAYERIIEEYNNALHPKQKLYPGKTRKQVLMDCVHPDIQPINLMQLARWAGKRVSTSVVRGQFVANYESYSVSVSMLDRLRGRDDKVEAYYWSQDEEQPVDQMYLYQDDVYLGVCPRIIPYQVSKLERTSSDMRLLGAQKRRVDEWDKAIEDNAPEGLIKISADTARQIELKPLRTIPMPLEGTVDSQPLSGIPKRANGKDRGFADI